MVKIAAAKKPSFLSDPWNMNSAWKQETASRASFCLNGMWEFLPCIDGNDKEVPAENSAWCRFKVPGVWPNTNGKNAQDVIMDKKFERAMAAKKMTLHDIDQAWYMREIEVPANWSGRRVLLDFTMLQTNAKIFVDGKESGACWFPGGRVDITDSIKFGHPQQLALLVTARPLTAVDKVFMANDRIIERKARIHNRGITGDLYLASEPKEDAFGDIYVNKKDTDLVLDLSIVNAGKGIRKFSAQILENGKVVKHFDFGSFDLAKLANGRTTFSAPWPDAKLWDLDTPQNMYELSGILSDEKGKVIDRTLPITFGFREFKIIGRDLYLNGSRIHVRSLNLGNNTDGADKACLNGCLNSCKRIQKFGFNHIISGDYSFNAGAVSYLDALYEATDKLGMLSSLTMPHCGNFEWKLDDPKVAQRYREVSEWLVRRMQNHPSIVMYAVNHNACGYYGDQNPFKINERYNPDLYFSGQEWTGLHRKHAKIAMGIIREIDPSRAIYNHESGNLGDIYSVNIYLNWSPMQERSDWLEQWATTASIPLFFVECGLPHISSFSSYRGPQFIWSCVAFERIWDSEFSASYINQNAYKMTPMKIKSLRWEQELWHRGQPFHWTDLIKYFDFQEECHFDIKALFVRENWRAYRTWGISAILPWDYPDLWQKQAKNFPIGDLPSEEIAEKEKYSNLQQPGIVPDRRVSPYKSYYYYWKSSGFRTSSLGFALKEMNKEMFGYIGGGPERFTEKSHNFRPGETVKKQLVILNDSRRDKQCSFKWTFGAGDIKGSGSVVVKPGDKAFIPVSISIPQGLKPGAYKIKVSFDFGNGETMKDSFQIDILGKIPVWNLKSKIALYDPKGMTTKALDNLGIQYNSVEANDSLDGYDILIVAREAISEQGGLPDIARIRTGLKVLVFEQAFDPLAQRMGFRPNIHGMRENFIRTPSHPALAGLSEANLHDWRGSATMTPPTIDVPEKENHDPTWIWLGFENTRAWRYGNYGNVCSVLIEKPSNGNWSAITDCGFDLQYAPLLEYTEGKGRMIFCQLDVTGRTENDPAAEKICANLLSYLDSAGAQPERTTVYCGDKKGANLLASLDIPFAKYSRQALDENTLLVLGPGNAKVRELQAAIKKGMNLLCLGLNKAELARLFPGKFKMTKAVMVPSLVKKFKGPLTGISNAELHWRTATMAIDAFKGVTETSNEELKSFTVGKGEVVLCQAAPWMFDHVGLKGYLRTTYRRNVFLASRLLHNLGAPSSSKLVEHWNTPGKETLFDLGEGWKGMSDLECRGDKEEWWKPGFADATWKPVIVPGRNTEKFPELVNKPGTFWYKLKFSVPATMSRDNPTLYIGGIDDESWVWLNGVFLGEMSKKTNPGHYWDCPRTYDLKSDILKYGGENTLVVKVNNLFLKAGMLSKPKITADGPWTKSYYLQKLDPEDDPYRYFRW